MGRTVTCCLQSLLKLVNSAIGLVGMGMILYALWMLRVWYRQVNGFWADGSDSTTPWFIYTFLGLGISICLIACSGHFAAETANGHCLSCAAITADVFLNRDWEEDFPKDPSGRFDELKDFIKSNFEMCKWIGLAIVAAQAMSIFLAMILRALGPDQRSNCDSDDEYITARLPLLRNQAQHTPYIIDPHLSLKNDSWNANR